LYRAVSI